MHRLDRATPAGGPPSRRAARFACVLEWAGKRGSVADDHLSGTTVADGLKRAYPSVGRADLSRSYLLLLRVGFAKPPRCRDAGALLPHRFSFSPADRGGGVFFSVALSVGSRRPAVSWHPALWSPDFPHAPAFGARGRLAHSTTYSSSRDAEARWQGARTRLWRLTNGGLQVARASRQTMSCRPCACSLAHVSLRVSVRLKTRALDDESRSRQK